MTQSVGIIGHGLTGITAAIMLARAGYQIDLIGPKPEFSGGLQLAPNGLAALQTLGHYEAVRKKAVRLESIRITAMGDGRSLADISHNDKRIYLGMGRADLYQLLAKHLSQQKNIRTLASPAVHLASSGEKMEILLEDGRSVHADEIIGADGANGLCRSFVAGARLGRKEAPYYAMRAQISADILPRLFSRPQTQLMLGDGCHFVSYPIAAQKQINCVFCASAEALHPEWEADMLAEHPLLKYLYAAKPQWAKLPLYRDDPIASWRRMGVTLTGDAAHMMPPHLAQGAGQGFEDIACLAVQLAKKDLSAGLRSMAIERAGQLKPVSGKAGVTGRVMRLSGLPGQLRDSLLGLAGAQLVESWLEDIWQGTI